MPLSVLCLLLVGSGCTDRIESAYASLDEAVAAGAVKRGWVPDFLPGSSTQIREIHDLDTNEVWLRFNYSREDHESFVGQLSPSSANALQSAPLRDPGVDWWDHGELMQLAEDGRPGEVYHAVQDRGLVLLLLGHSEGYLWRYTAEP